MKYPIGIQDFENIRRDGYVYVDKTSLVYELATSGKYYFLSRPRRFGKSLFISTLEAYFSGRKDLFEGLAIAELEKDWAQYPVIRIDFTGASYTSDTVLKAKLSSSLAHYEAIYSSVSNNPVASIRFEALIQAAHNKTGKPVVILIDEYDKPIVDNLGNPALMEAFRSQLQGFYSVMKAKDAYIKFGFLTGVSKIGKLSVFSCLNNLNDISMDAQYAAICGISEQELKTCFSESIKQMAVANNLSEQDCSAELAKMYDGYHFHRNSPGMYNPFSLFNALQKKEFGQYWFSTGTPTFLAKYLAEGNYQLDDVAEIKVNDQDLAGTNALRPDVITLLYQTGYLTIKGYDSVTKRYTLGYPNQEVEDGFLDALSKYFTPIHANYSDLSVDKFVHDIQTGNAEILMRRFSAFFADMDYQIQGKAEMYFQNTMYVMLKLMGQQVDVERHTSNGRIDVLIQTPDYIYIIELKRDQDPQNALDQISDKGYDWPFRAGNRKVFKIGASFCTATRRLEKWEIEAEE